MPKKRFSAIAGGVVLEKIAKGLAGINGINV